MEHKKKEVDLNMIMVGKTGHGKSATGNMILNRRAFKTSTFLVSESKEIKNSFAEFDDVYLYVVDGPGLEDTSKSKDEDKIAAAQNMDKALDMCYGGVDAFLLVIKFGSKFTTEELQVVISLKSIFGDKFMSHVIVVITRGDSFQQEVEDSEQNISFSEWCMAQTGPFLQLYQECKGRFILFNNLEKDMEKKRKQRLQLVQLVHHLHTASGRYTSQCFKAAEYNREKMILECRAPHLKKEIQMKISLLVAAIENLRENPSDEGTVKIEFCINFLRNEISKHDKSYNVLSGIMDLLKQVEENFDNVKELHRLSQVLEDIRESKYTAGMLGAAGVGVTLAAAILVPPIGIPLAVAQAAVTAAGIGCLHGVEKEVKEKQQQIETKRTYLQLAIEDKMTSTNETKN